MDELLNKPETGSVIADASTLGHREKAIRLHDPRNIRDEIVTFPQPVRFGTPPQTVIDELLDKLETLETRHPLGLWEIRWYVETQAKGAALEYDEAHQCELEKLDNHNARVLRRHDVIDRLIEELESHREQAEERHEAACEVCVRTLAETDLPPMQGDFSPEGLEEALADGLDTEEEFCGRIGATPPAEQHRSSNSVLAKSLTMILELFMPIIPGFVLAITFGMLTGLITMVDLQRGDPVKMLGAASLGAFIVGLMGQTAKYVARLLAHQMESNKATIARYRFMAGIVMALLLVLTGFLAAEVFGEAHGISDLHAQRLIALLRLNPGALVTPIRFGVYLLIGCLISGPYVVLKGLRELSECEGRLRGAWIAAQRKDQMDTYRSTPSFKAVLAATSAAKLLKDRIAEIDSRIGELRAERDELVILDDFDEATKAYLDHLRLAAGVALATAQAMVRDYIDMVEART